MSGPDNRDGPFSAKRVAWGCAAGKVGLLTSFCLLSRTQLKLGSWQLLAEAQYVPLTEMMEGAVSNRPALQCPIGRGGEMETVIRSRRDGAACSVVVYQTVLSHCLDCLGLVSSRSSSTCCVSDSIRSI